MIKMNATIHKQNLLLFYAISARLFGSFYRFNNFPTV